MTNSKWFWLAICLSGMLAGTTLLILTAVAELSDGQFAGSLIGGLVLIFFSIMFFSGDLYHSFNKWLDELQ